MRKLFIKFRQGVAETKLRMDIGIQLLSVTNYILLVMAASGKLEKFFGIGTKQILIFAVPGMLFGIYLFGLVLEKYIKLPQEQEVSKLKRLPHSWGVMTRTEAKCDKILEILEAEL